MLYDAMDVINKEYTITIITTYLSYRIPLVPKFLLPLRQTSKNVINFDKKCYSRSGVSDPVILQEGMGT